MMFNNSSNVDASHSTFNEVHRDQFFTSRTNVQGNQTVNTVVHGNQIVQGSQMGLEALQKASVPSATFDSAERHPAPRCLQGTRIELLEHLARWANSGNEDDSDRLVCWVNGRPGSGKSAISQTIAETFAAQRRLAASFFFSHRDIERRTTRRFFPTIATQLLSSVPAIRPSIQATLEKDSMIPSKVLREQMQKLLLEPLSTGIEHTGPPLLIVIDALEECDDPRLVVELVSLLIQLVRNSPLPLRLLLTSRPEPWLLAHFRQQDVASITLTIDIQSFSVDDDIRSFLEHALEQVRQEHAQIMPDDEPWPSPEELDLIVEKSSGLFIFALTVVKFVGDRLHNPIQRLEAILQDTPSRDTTYSDLDALYLDAVSTFPDADTVRLILGVVYCLTVPMTVPALHRLLDQPDVDVRVAIPALGSVLLSSEDGQQPIQFYHASFRDFLVTPQRSRKYAIDPAVYHRLMAQLCFDVMVRSLERNMCEFDDPSKLNRDIEDLAQRREEAYDEALLYACRYWSYHLTELPAQGGTYESLLDSMREFCSKVLLYWIESASIFDDMEYTIIMLRDALNWLKSLATVPKETAELVEDAERLVLLFKQPISQSAPHVYHSAIAFSPSTSALYSHFQHEVGSKWTIEHGRDDHWQAYQYAIDLGSKITSIAFSPNGDLVASAGPNQGVQLWNVVTGGNIASFAGNDSSLIVRFANSGDYMAAAFEDGTVAVWDPDLGQELFEDTDPHTDVMTCLEFSPNSSLLASGARDHAIQLWLVDSAERSHKLSAHEGPITVLAFTPDSRHLCSGSEDSLIFIWDVNAGNAIHGMMSHSGPITSLDVSCDITMVVSGSQDKTVKVWDVDSGKCTRTVSKGHKGVIRSVHFFDDGKRVLSASDGMILSSNTHKSSSDTTVWDVGQNLQATMNNSSSWQAKLIGRGLPTFLFKMVMETPNRVTPSDEQLLVAYSPQSSSFAFSHFAESWSAPVGSRVKSPSIHESQAYITSLALSPDGTRIAAGNFIGALDILDTTLPTREWDEEIKRDHVDHLRTASIVVPSPNGARFLVNSGLSWYLADGHFHLLSKVDFGIADYVRTNDIAQPVFSADSSTFAWCMSDILERQNHTTVRVYDARAGTQTVRFQGLKKMHAFVVSPDGNLVGCGHEGALVVCVVGQKAKRVMNVVADVSITALAFSNDSKLLLSGSNDGVLQLWDVSSGTCKATFSDETFKSAATAVGFAPFGDMAVIAHKDGAVRLVSLSTSASHALCPSETTFTKDVETVSFLQDAIGWRLACRTDDNSVSFWTVPEALFSATSEGRDGGEQRDDARVCCSLCERGTEEAVLENEEGEGGRAPDDDEEGPAPDDDGEEEPVPGYQEVEEDPDPNDEQEAGDVPPREEEEEQRPAYRSLPHLISRYEGRVFDVGFRTMYMIRKDGWVCRGDWERMDGNGDGGDDDDDRNGDMDGDEDEDEDGVTNGYSAGGGDMDAGVVDGDIDGDEDRVVDGDGGWDGAVDEDDDVDGDMDDDGEGNGAVDENEEVAVEEEDGDGDGDGDRDRDGNANGDEEEEDGDHDGPYLDDDIEPEDVECLFWLPHHMRPLYNDPQFSAFNGKMMILTHNRRVLFLTLGEDERR